MTTAATAAKRGKKVLVIEKHKVLGGYASVFGRKGTTFDVSLHQIGGVKKTRLRGILKEAGVYDKLEFVKSPTLSDLYLGPNKPLLPIPNGDGDAFKRKLLGMFPKDRFAIRLWFWVMRRYGRQIGYWDNIRRNSALRQGATIFFAPLFAPLLVATVFPMITLSKTLRSTDPELRKILLHFSGYYGSPADEINLLFPMAANASYYYDGGYYLKGGGYAITRQMSLIIRKNGGKILTGREVETILTDGKRVSGVKMKGKEGATYLAPEIVCGANPFTVYDKMLPEHPVAKRELARISKMDVGMTASVLYMKINVPVEQLNPAFAGVYEYVEPPHEDERTYYKRFRTRGFDGDYRHDGLNLTVHSKSDPEAMKGDKGALIDILYCDNYDRWAKLDEEEYQAQKAIAIEKMLDIAEGHLPGLRQHIEILEMATPRTMEKFTSNRRGAIYGFSQKLSQSIQRRFRIKSPIRGLNFVSAWSNPGGGYEGVLRAADAYLNPINWKGLAVFLGLIAASTQISTVIHILFA